MLLPGQQSTGETLVNDNKCDNSVTAFKSLATSAWQRPSKDYRQMSTCPSVLLNKIHLIVHFRYNLSFVIKGLIWGFIYFLVGIPFCILGSQLLSPYSVGYIIQELHGVLWWNSVGDQTHCLTPWMILSCPIIPFIINHLSPI